MECKRLYVIYAKESGFLVKSKSLEKKQKKVCKKFTDHFITSRGADPSIPFWAAVVEGNKKTITKIKKSAKEAGLYVDSMNLLELPNGIMDKAEHIANDEIIDYYYIGNKPKPKKQDIEEIEDSEFSIQDYIYDTLDE